MLKQLVKNINEYIFGGETVEDMSQHQDAPRHDSELATQAVNSLVVKAAAVYNSCIEKCGNAPMQTIIVEEVIPSGDINPLEMTINPPTVHSPVLEVREIYADFNEDGSEVIVTGIFNPLSPHFPQ